MCRFWARLVWRLPSLRIWTASVEGQREMAAYADDAGTADNNTATAAGYTNPLSPWRCRYAYYLRLDTDSFLHQPLACGPFVKMAMQRCAYGYNALVLDIPNVSQHLGDAIAEWIASRTNDIDVGDEGGGGAAVVRTNVLKSLVATEDWGPLKDPALLSVVTLVSREEVGQEPPPPPPLPPTWPWSNVYTGHSSVALAAAKTEVLRAFSTDAMKAWDTGQSSSALRDAARRVNATEMLREHLLPGYARQRTYNLLVYYNNFELGTFAGKNHPLYTSITELLDNGDSDDATGMERAASGVDYTLTELQLQSPPGGVPGAAAANPQRHAYASRVYLLTRKEGGLPTISSPSTAPLVNTTVARERCRGSLRRQRLLHHATPPEGDVDNADVPVQRTAAAALAGGTNREWHSGYLQYRWGDVPVHTFGVEAVMQREGWAVCTFTEDLGWYEHGFYRPR
jgi:hypothetical protein